MFVGVGVLDEKEGGEVDEERLEVKDESRAGTGLLPVRE